MTVECSSLNRMSVSHPPRLSTQIKTEAQRMWEPEGEEDHERLSSRRDVAVKRKEHSVCDSLHQTWRGRAAQHSAADVECVIRS